MGIAMAVVLTVLAAGPAIVFGNTYLMTGKISAIDLAYNTVVIEVPMVSKTFTVGGPLAPDAMVIKDDQPTGLDDFKIGEQVTVKWHSTPQGHVIDRLVAK
jgi:hypothetical protein